LRNKNGAKDLFMLAGDTTYDAIEELIQEKQVVDPKPPHKWDAFGGDYLVYKNIVIVNEHNLDDGDLGILSAPTWEFGAAKYPVVEGPMPAPFLEAAKIMNLHDYFCFVCTNP